MNIQNHFFGGTRGILAVVRDDIETGISTICGKFDFVVSVEFELL